MAAVAANPGAFRNAAADPKLFAQMASAAALAKTKMSEMSAQSAAMYAALTAHAQTFAMMADRHPQALASMMANATAYARFARDTQALDAALAARGSGDDRFAASATALQRLSGDAQARIHARLGSRRSAIRSAT